MEVYYKIGMSINKIHSIESAINCVLCDVSANIQMDTHTHCSFSG